MKNKSGRPRNIKAIKRAKKLRKYLSYREIAKKMNKNIASVYRWINY